MSNLTLYLYKKLFSNFEKGSFFISKKIVWLHLQFTLVLHSLYVCLFIQTGNLFIQTDLFLTLFFFFYLKISKLLPQPILKVKYLSHCSCCPRGYFLTL